MVNFGMAKIKIMEILRNPVSLLFIFVLPIGLTLFTGLFFEKGQKELQVPIALVDEDQTEFSKTIIGRMNGQSKIHFHEVTSELAERMLLRNEVDSVFVIKKGFQENLLNENREQTIDVLVTPSSMAVGIVKELMASEVIRLTSNIKASEHVVKLFKVLDIQHDNQETLWDEAYLYTDRQWEPEPLMTVQYQLLGEEINGKSKELTYSPFLGLWTFFTMLSCFLTSDWIVREKAIVFSRIQSTYLGLIPYVLQISGIFLLFHVLQTIVCYIIFTCLNIIQAGFDDLLMMIVFMFFSSALGVWIASCTKYMGNYYIASFLVVLFLGIAGGSFFPIHEFSNSLIEFPHIFPQDVLLYRENGAMKIQTLFIICVSVFLWVLAVRRLRIK